MSYVVPFSRPGLKRYRPSRAPEAQRVAATALYEEFQADPSIDEVTTMVPRQGGAAIMVGWQYQGDGEKVPVGHLMITIEGEVVRPGGGSR